jgi:hypothetical protein
MYDDCDVTHKGAVIPVIMQDLRKSKANIDRGKVSSSSNISDAASLSVKSWNLKSVPRLSCLLIGKRRPLQTRKSSA